MVFQRKQKNTCLICGYYYDIKKTSGLYGRKEFCQDCSNKINNAAELFAGNYQFDERQTRKQNSEFLTSKRQDFYDTFLSQCTQGAAINLLGFSLYVGEEIGESCNRTFTYKEMYLQKAVEEIKEILKKNCKKAYTQIPSQNFNQCLICQRETNGSPFCEKCKEDHSQIELLDILNDTIIPKSIAEIPPHSIQEKKTNPCFFCGAETTETFCHKCSSKYAGKNLAIIIHDLREVKRIQEVDKYYSFAIHRCEDGHVVRSKSEVIIDNFLYNHNIKHAYEKPLTVKGITIHPDFYLPELDIYIEHLGYRGYKKYDSQTDFKKALYDKTVIYTTEEDISQLEEALLQKLTAAMEPKYKELPSEGFTNCVICNTKTKGYAFCKSCWQDHTEDELLEILNNPHPKLTKRSKKI